MTAPVSQEATSEKIPMTAPVNQEKVGEHNYIGNQQFKSTGLKSRDVPQDVKSAFSKKYPEATKVSWEKEKGNYEANWGGKSGEDSSVPFTPSGVFVEMVKAISIADLPKNVASYVKEHYKGKIKEAGRVTDAAGKTMYEAEIKGGDLIFDEHGNFIKRIKKYYQPFSFFIHAVSSSAIWRCSSISGWPPQPL